MMSAESVHEKVMTSREEEHEVHLLDNSIVTMVLGFAFCFIALHTNVLFIIASIIVFITSITVLKSLQFTAIKQPCGSH